MVMTNDKCFQSATWAFWTQSTAFQILRQTSMTVSIIDEHSDSISAALVIFLRRTLSWDTVTIVNAVKMTVISDRAMFTFVENTSYSVAPSKEQFDFSGIFAFDWGCSDPMPPPAIPLAPRLPASRSAICDQRRTGSVYLQVSAIIRWGSIPLYWRRVTVIWVIRFSGLRLTWPRCCLFTNRKFVIQHFPFFIIAQF